MSPKEQFDACMKLAEFGAARWDARRRYEWSLSVGVWALLAAAIGTLRFEVLPIWIGVVAVSLYGWWSFNLWRRNKWERQFMWNFLFEAQRICSKHEIKTVKSDESLWARFFVLDWAVQFQFGATLLLTVVVYLVCAKKISFLELVVGAGSPAAR
jgi:hypothetical protein